MIRYTVTADDYRRMARYLLLKKRGKGVYPVMKLLLATVVQMGFAAWLIAAYPEAAPWMRILLAVCSLIWAGLSAFRFFFLDFRTEMLVRQAEREDPSTHFFGEHRLSLEDDVLHLSFGENRLELPCPEITEVEQAGSLTLISRGKDVFELIPESAAAREEWPAFLAELEDARTRRQREKRDGTEAWLRQEADFITDLPLTEDETVQMLTDLRRRSLLTRPYWSGKTLFTFLFPLGLAIYCAAAGQWLYFALCFMTFLLFNIRLLSVLTPLYKRAVREQLQPAADGGYVLALAKKSAWLLTRFYAFEYPLKTLKQKVKRNGALYLYFDDQTMLFVPPQAAEGFARAMTGRKSLHSLAYVPEDPEEVGEEET